MNDFRLSRRALLGLSLGGLCSLLIRPASAGIAIVSEGAAVPRWRTNVLLASQIRLGRRLVAELAGSNDANVIVSPASLAATLAMLSTAADRPLQRAIHGVLGFDRVSSRRSARHVTELKAALGHLQRQAVGESPLSLANMMVIDPRSRPRADALARLTVDGADISVEDLRKPETIQRINDWVAQRTHKRIPSILRDPLSHAGLVAINALYFKDKWKTPFDPARTRMRPFHPVGRKPADTAMMESGNRRFMFRQGKRFIAVELPYANDDFKLVVVTTKDRPARTREFSRVMHWLGGKKFSEGDGRVVLPRIFDMAAEADLLRALDAMGLSPARRRREAFSALTDVPQSLSRVVQKAMLRLDEEGTEAAAATAAITYRSVSTGNFTSMIVDKPFIFALRDVRAGLVLLSGYIGDVTGEG